MKIHLTILVILLFGQAFPAIAQSTWRHLESPYAGYVTTIVPSRTLGIIAGTSDHGIYRSTDAGSHWTNLPFHGGRVSAVIEAPGPLLYTVSESGPVWSSADSGRTWQLKSTGLEGKTVTHIATNSTGKLFAAASDGVYRSVDKGDHWFQVNTGLGNLRVMQVGVSSDDHLFATTFRNGVFRSYDSGDSWLSIGGTLSSEKTRSITIDKYRVIYVGTENDGVFSTGDDGNTWNHLVAFGTFPALGLDNASNIVALDDNGILTRSTDGGVHWRTLSNDNLTFIVNTFSFDAGGVLYGGTKGAGIFKSISGVNGWTRIGFSAASVASLMPIPGGRILAATTNSFLHDGGVWYTSNLGATWETTSLFTVQMKALAAGIDGSVLGATADAIYGADSNGTTWTQLTYGNPPGTITTVTQLTNGDQFAGTFTKGVYRYSKGGAQWIFAGCDSSTVFGFARLHSGAILAATEKGLFRSQDESTWETSNLLPGVGKVTTVRDEGEFILAGTDSAVYRSTDQGEHWTQTQIEGVSSPPPRISSFSESRLPVVFAATSMGVFRSTNEGLQWSQFGSELDSIDVTSVVFTPSKYVLVGTAGNGLYVSNNVVNGVETDDQAVNLPAEFRLDQNFPNPFNPSTTIRYSLSHAAVVHLEVYSVLGERVASLLNGFSTAGSHATVWNAGDCASGEYIAVLSGEGFRLIRKMVLIR